MEGIKRSLLFALFLIICTMVQAQRLTVQGKVISKTDGEPIIGATVIETNQTGNGTITNIDGAFSRSFFPIQQRLERAMRHTSTGFELMQSEKEWPQK